MPIMKIQVYDGWKKKLEMKRHISQCIGRTETAMLVGVSDSKLRRLIEDGDFPEPDNFANGSHAFWLDDVITWTRLHLKERK